MNTLRSVGINVGSRCKVPGRAWWISLLGLLLGIGGIHASDIDSRGIGWSKLEKKVDKWVKKTMEKHDIVGMTVAVSKEGRLILSKGYGYAKANILSGGGLEFAPMLPILRTRIGSVSKVVVTGPVATMLMQEKGIDPQTQRLYGENGVLGNQFAFDQQINNQRFFPILAMAITSKDRVYTWYVDGYYSVGTSKDLDRYQKRKPFGLPQGYERTDIVAIAISKSGRVYTWYANGTRSVGTADDLDRYKKPDREKAPVTLPKGKTMRNIVGIAIAKSNDRVYVWYDDGTRSVGSSLNLAKHSSGQQYKTPSEQIGGTSRYDIRGIGISRNDRVYVWYGNNTVSSGSSLDLDKYLKPYEYSFPEIYLDDKRFYRTRWWSSITLGYLLTHRSGFQRSGDVKGTEVMFGLPEESLTYALVHKHFLRTRSLRWAPGLVRNNRRLTSYSNHGFGLWKMLVPVLTGGITYEQYAMERYLRPMGLAGKVRPMSLYPDPLDADAYLKEENATVKQPYKPSGLGIAAGGWTASAQSVLWITRNLSRKYTVEELKNMGWLSRSGGENNNYESLFHNGLIAGGMAYVVMFPGGYISKSGKDLSEVHIALATNTSYPTRERNNEALSALVTLANKIAVAVPDSDIPASWNIWGGFPELQQHAIDRDMYPFVFEHGYRPVWVDAYRVKGRTFFNLILRPNDGVPWVARHGLNSAQYQAEFNKWIQKGFRPLQVESYVEGNQVRYAVVFIKRGGPAWRAYHGKSPQAHQTAFNSLVAQGYRPVNISVVSVGNRTEFTALYEKKNVGHFLALANIPLAQFQKRFDENRKAGRQLVYLNAWEDGGKVYFSAIWNAATKGAYKARHNLSRTQYGKEWEKQTDKGFLTRFVTGYEVNGVHRFATLWYKTEKKRVVPVKGLKY